MANNGFKPFEMLFKASRCDDMDLVKAFTGELNSKLRGMVRGFSRAHAGPPSAVIINRGVSFLCSCPTSAAAATSPASWR